MMGHIEPCPIRFCGFCYLPLERKEREHPAHFRRRRFCDSKHSDEYKKSHDTSLMAYLASCENYKSGCEMMADLYITQNIGCKKLGEYLGVAENTILNWAKR